jgi:hypothetical protein
LKKTIAIILLSVLILSFMGGIASAVSYEDPGGIFSKTSGKIKGFGIGIALLGFMGSWVISAISLGDDKIIAQGKKGAVVAVVSGLVLTAGAQIFDWFLA